jgi:hypothetical protein
MAFFWHKGVDSSRPNDRDPEDERSARQPPGPIAEPALWMLRPRPNACHLFLLFHHLYDDMVTANTMPPTALNDAQLVAECLAGNRQAFGRIVERYQNLVCSLALWAS